MPGEYPVSVSCYYFYYKYKVVSSSTQPSGKSRNMKDKLDLFSGRGSKQVLFMIKIQSGFPSVSAVVLCCLLCSRSINGLFLSLKQYEHFGERKDYVNNLTEWSLLNIKLSK